MNTFEIIITALFLLLIILLAILVWFTIPNVEGTSGIPFIRDRRTYYYKLIHDLKSDTFDLHIQCRESDFEDMPTKNIEVYNEGEINRVFIALHEKR